MKNIILTFVTAENYTTVIAALVILVCVLYVVLALFGKKDTKVAVVTACSMALVAILCVSTIVTSIPFMSQDVDAYVSQSTESMFEDYSIDALMVNVNAGN